MNVLLKLKHWQLFLLMITPPLVGTGLMIYDCVEIFREVAVYPQNVAQMTIPLMNASMWMLWGALLPLLIYVLWMWAVNMNLRYKLSPDFQRSGVRFSVVYSIPMLYMIFMPFFMYYTFYDIISAVFIANNLGVDESIGEEIVQKMKILFPIYFSLSLLSMPASLYLAYRTGRILKTLETKTSVAFSDYILEIILVLFFPIVGVWLLQPQVNRYVELEDWNEDENPTESDNPAF